MRVSTLIALSFALLVSLLAAESTEAATLPKSSTPSRKGKAVKQINTTCTRFRDACVKAVMDGKTFGQIPVVYDCYRKKPKKTAHFFSCRSGGVNYTQRALKNLYGGSTSTITSASTTTATVATETDVTSTDLTLLTTTTDTATTTTTDVLGTTTTQTALETDTVQETTIESYTITGTTTTFVPTTVVSTETSTSTSTLTMTTGVNEVFPVTDVWVTGQRPNRRGVDSTAEESSFCTSYSDACRRQCDRFDVAPRFELCKENGSGSYSLSCACSNGKIETQHALADIGNDQHIEVVSTLSTFSTTAAMSTTIVIPTTVVSTHTVTTTSRIPTATTIVSTVTSTGTVTATATSSTTLTSSTTIPVTTPAATTTKTSVDTATATTLVILAPTGVVRATYADGSPDRYISRKQPTFRSLNTLVLDKTLADPVMFVYDKELDLYALQYTTGGLFMSLEYGNTMTPTGYGFLASNAGRPAGPAGGQGTWQGRAYETFVYRIDPKSITSSQIPLQGAWVQPDRSLFTPLYYAATDDPPRHYVFAAGPDNSWNRIFPRLDLALVAV